MKKQKSTPGRGRLQGDLAADPQLSLTGSILPLGRVSRNPRHGRGADHEATDVVRQGHGDARGADRVHG